MKVQEDTLTSKMHFSKDSCFEASVIQRDGFLPILTQVLHYVPTNWPRLRNSLLWDKAEANQRNLERVLVTLDQKTLGPCEKAQ